MSSLFAHHVIQQVLEVVLAGFGWGQELVAKRTLLLEELIESHVEACITVLRMDREWRIHVHRFVLTNPIHAIGRLVFDRRVPPPTKMNDMVCARNREAHASRARRQDQNAEPRLLLE